LEGLDHKRERSEAGGIYLFDGDAAAQAFVDGPIISETKGTDLEHNGIRRDP